MALYGTVYKIMESVREGRLELPIFSPSKES